jgi:GNAT superfamily N-acetyltransferase
VELIRIVDAEGLAPYAGNGVLADFEPATLGRHRADEHWLALAGGEPVARCSLWWREAPPHGRERLGVIGHYRAREAVGGTALLRHACERLAAMGCTRAVGPMDGNTWRRYRLVTFAGEESPFFLEPYTPQDWPGHFTSAGFSPQAQYSSALNVDLEQRHPRVERASERLRDAGVAWRSLDVDAFDDELRRIYRISLQSFPRNYLYTPLGEDEFLTQYRQLRPHVPPELTLMAEAEGEPVGYLFALPDLLQMGRQPAIDTFIIKTVAVLPGRRSAGLGSVLVAEAQHRAARLGYRRAIHALMHEANNSRNISGKYARTMRRYTLFGRPLPPAR